ncbi:hypothetical protein FHN55_05685 [Streptomyces sp. NP160]|uniref:hypothetical protein n=1 Tax=Streptomyces sp. NP160 TaxID=2586637 RepID=UPI001119E31C|nr:hypothetical protein [Streptomyces sp. NP160]TNM68711.1 hypothetical protein FHN55_05685 [Streptomyces sp. NP160]
MTSSALPRWVVGDDADHLRGRMRAEEGVVDLAEGLGNDFWDDFWDGDLDGVLHAPFDGDPGAGGDEAVLVGFSAPWWVRALSQDPLTGSIAERRLIRPAIAAAVAGEPCPAQVAALDALHAALGGGGDGAGGVGLTSREWTEVTAAVERCTSYLFALKLVSVSGLDAAKLAENPARAAAKDSRRPAADELAPVLRIAGGTATALVGLARQLGELPAAEAALTGGVMTPAQLQELATVCRRLPQGPAGDAARRVVEATAVAAAATLSRARLVKALEEAALEADPGYAARAMAAGVQERDVVLRPSPKPGCQRVVAGGGGPGDRGRGAGVAGDQPDRGERPGRGHLHRYRYRCR